MMRLGEAFFSFFGMAKRKLKRHGPIDALEHPYGARHRPLGSWLLADVCKTPALVEF